MPRTSIEKKGPIQDYEKEDDVINPFVSDYYFGAYRRMYPVKIEVGADIDEDHTGEKERLSVDSPYLVDVVESTKIFHGSEDHEDKVLKLPSGALRLFILLIFRTTNNTDRVRIFADKYAERTGIESATTFYRAIENLIDAGIIAKYKMNIYWINPLIFFNGNRLKKYAKKVRIIKKPEKDE